MMKTLFLAAALAVAACTAVPAADDGHNPDVVPNRLSFARTGEWASYDLPSGYVQKLTVTGRTTEAGRDRVTIRVENIYEGEVVTASDITEDAGEPFTAPRVPADDGVAVFLRDDVAELNGKPVAVSVVEIYRHDDDPDEAVTTEYWITTDVPVFGILKKVENGEIEWQLRDFSER